MSPLVKALFKKKAKLNRLGHNISLTSGKFGSRAWWPKVDQLPYKTDKSATNLDEKFIEGLNSYIRTHASHHWLSLFPQLSSAHVYHALSGINGTATGPDGISILGVESTCCDLYSRRRRYTSILYDVQYLWPSKIWLPSCKYGFVIMAVLCATYCQNLNYHRND